jgi:hypothetical protein
LIDHGIQAISKGELENFHDFITTRYEYRTTEEYRNILAAFRNTRAIEASHAIRRCEEITDMQILLDDCRDTTADILDHLKWL